MSLWGRVKQAFSASRTPETGTYELSPGSPEFTTNVENWRRQHSGTRHGDRGVWDVYRRVPEVRAAVEWLTLAMSRVKLYPAWIPDDGGDPQPIEEDARDPETTILINAVRELFGGPLQQATMLRDWYRYRLVAGECIIAAVKPTIEERKQYAILDEWLWMVRDATPVSGTNTGTNITLTWETHRGAITREFNTANVPDDVIFVHNRVRDPANPTLTMSPTRTVMDDAEVLINVADSINAMSVSRITTAGMIAVTADVTIPGFGGPGAPEDEDPILAGLTDTMAARNDNRRSAASRGPDVFRASIRSDKASINDAITTIDTSTKYDERTLDILDWGSRRVAINFNVPVEVTNGTADPNHWNALQEGQDGARIVIAPNAADFCRLMTEVWFQWRAITSGVSVKTIRQATLWYDASALVQDPDRSATLIALRNIDPRAVTTQEMRRACSLPSEPDEPDFAPPLPAVDRRTGQRRAISDDEVRNSAQAAVPSIPGGRPIVRIPGFPTPPVGLVNGGARRA